jgi:transketolase
MKTATTSAIDQVRLEAIARRIRISILETVHAAGAGHIGGPLSVVELLTALYFSEMNIDPARPDDPERDRFLLSKGHSSPALYAILAERGYFPAEELATFDAIDSRLQAHPDMTVLPGLDMSTGSLGQGLSAGLGLALAARLSDRAYRTFVILGDGECQEGQVWEAAMVAARYKVDSLVAIVDWNGLQQYGWHRPGEPEDVREAPLREPAAIFDAFGWNVDVIDGHDFGEIMPALTSTRSGNGRPTCIIARTTKGKGVSFMEGNYIWHSSLISDSQLEAARVELGG